MAVDAVVLNIREGTWHRPRPVCPAGNHEVRDTMTGIRPSTATREPDCSGIGYASVIQARL